jgi:16S rRNA G966 N2-methylase RsmD
VTTSTQTITTRGRRTIPEGFVRVIDDEYPEHKEGVFPRLEKHQRPDGTTMIRTEHTLGNYTSSTRYNLMLYDEDFNCFMTEFDKYQKDHVNLDKMILRYIKIEGLRNQNKKAVECLKMRFNYLERLSQNRAILFNGYYPWRSILKIWFVGGLHKVREHLNYHHTVVYLRMIKDFHAYTSDHAARNVRTHDDHIQVWQEPDGWSHLVPDNLEYNDIYTTMVYKNLTRSFVIDNIHEINMFTDEPANIDGFFFDPEYDNISAQEVHAFRELVRCNDLPDIADLIIRQENTNNYMETPAWHEFQESKIIEKHLAIVNPRIAEIRSLREVQYEDCKDKPSKMMLAIEEARKNNNQLVIDNK